MLPNIEQHSVTHTHTHTQTDTRALLEEKERKKEEKKERGERREGEEREPLTCSLRRTLQCTLSPADAPGSVQTCSSQGTFNTCMLDTHKHIAATRASVPWRTKIQAGHTKASPCTNATQTHRGTQRRTATYQDMPNKVHNDAPRHTPAHQDAARNPATHSDVPGHAQQGTQRRTQTHTGAPGRRRTSALPGTHRRTQSHRETHRRTQRDTATHQDTYRHTATYHDTPPHTSTPRDAQNPLAQTLPLTYTPTHTRKSRSNSPQSLSLPHSSLPRLKPRSSSDSYTPKIIS